MTLTEFLLARVAEDEVRSRVLRPGYPSPARMLAECEAKRQIVELATEQQKYDEERAAGWDAPYDPAWSYGGRTLAALALPYADHPDFRDEWRA